MGGGLVGLVAIGVSVSVIGYAIYFDYKRRSDPEFRRHLRNIYTP